jgi:hypothetical protein
MAVYGRRVSALGLMVLIALSAVSLSAARDPNEITIKPQSKVYVQPGEFGNFIMAALQKKKVPVLITADEEAADYVVTGTSESNKAGWAKTIFMGQTGSNEEASISVIRRADKVVVWAYNVHKRNSAKGKQSSAEACAKHLKDIVR